jgi:hypothetical protein
MRSLQPEEAVGTVVLGIKVLSRPGIPSIPVRPRHSWQIVSHASGLQIEPVRHRRKIGAGLRISSITTQWKPVDFRCDPLEKISLLIRELFHRTRILLVAQAHELSVARGAPSGKIPGGIELDWHPFCAAFLTVEHNEFETGRGRLSSMEP